MINDPAKYILDVPRRPTMGDASGAAIISALALGFLTKDLGVALAGGAVVGALASRKQPLEFAVREYFREKSLPVSFFYRAPRSIKVTFTSAPHNYWTVESRVPEQVKPYLNSNDDQEDWLYGNLIKNELPETLRRMGLSA